jgi:hypothetical protein
MFEYLQKPENAQENVPWRKIYETHGKLSSLGVTMSYHSHHTIISGQYVGAIAAGIIELQQFNERKFTKKIPIELQTL